MWKPIEMLLERLRQAAQTGEILNMKYFYAAVTMDIINAYCFARAPGIVKLPDFGRQSVDDTEGFLLVSLLNIHFPWFLRITYSLPVCLGTRFRHTSPLSTSSPIRRVILITALVM